MEEMKMSRKTFFFILIPFFILAVFVFYWYEWRPTQIRSECDMVAWNRTKEISEDIEYYDWKYAQCLHYKGLK
jgi:hypothetical protein